jgi:hypothetical protein
MDLMHRRFPSIDGFWAADRIDPWLTVPRSH